MTVKELKEELDKIPEEAGIFIKEGNALVPITEIIRNDITETDYKESYAMR